MLLRVFIETWDDVMVLQGCFMFILVTGSYLRNNVQVLLQIPDVHLKMMNHTPGFWTGFFSHHCCEVPHSVESPPFESMGSNLLNLYTTERCGNLSSILARKNNGKGLDSFLFSLLPHPSQKKQQQTRYPFRSSQVAGFSSNSSGYHGLPFQRHPSSQHPVPINSFREGQFGSPFGRVRYCNFACVNQLFNFINVGCWETILFKISCFLQKSEVSGLVRFERNLDLDCSQFFSIMIGCCRFMSCIWVRAGLVLIP